MWWVEKQINVCKINAKYNKLNHIIYLAPLQNIIYLLATKLIRTLVMGGKTLRARGKKQTNKIWPRQAPLQNSKKQNAGKKTYFKGKTDHFKDRKNGPF